MQREKQPELFKKAGNQKDEEEDYFLRACLFKSKIDEAHCDGQIERKGKNGGNRAPEPVGEECGKELEFPLYVKVDVYVSCNGGNDEEGRTKNAKDNGK